LAEASSWLEDYRRFWEGSFRNLDELLEEMKAVKQKAERTKRKGEVR
jgi:hypothetical protein